MPTLPLFGRLLSEGPPKHRQVAITRSKIVTKDRPSRRDGGKHEREKAKQAWPLHSIRMLLFCV
jgi:hypothetical protein